MRSLRNPAFPQPYVAPRNYGAQQHWGTGTGGCDRVGRAQTWVFGQLCKNFLLVSMQPWGF